MSIPLQNKNIDVVKHRHIHKKWIICLFFYPSLGVFFKSITNPFILSQHQKIPYFSSTQILFFFNWHNLSLPKSFWHMLLTSTLISPLFLYTYLLPALCTSPPSTPPHLVIEQCLQASLPSVQCLSSERRRRQEVSANICRALVNLLIVRKGQLY